MSPVPATRVRAVHTGDLRPGGDYVLYWMTAARRTRWSFALDRALEHARALGKPLLVLEALRCGYRWASDRIHRFVLEGMADNAARFEAAGVAYHPYVEDRPLSGSGLLEALSARACVVVTDDFPCFFLPRMLASAARRVAVSLEAVDGNGLLPMRSTDRAFPTAYAFRRHLQKALPAALADLPTPDPLARARLPKPAPFPRAVSQRWPRASAALLAAGPAALSTLPIDHGVGPASMTGGAVAGEATLATFLARGLAGYGERRNDPDAEATSGLSPWLHFGHVSAHEVVHAVLSKEGRAVADLVAGGNGSREGWWDVSASAEAFLDQVVTWRELGFNGCVHRPDMYDRFDSLPDWALRTLSEHARDERPRLYSRARLDAARTHDDVWNAAQRELVATGRMHNYLRMLWGKKILEWSDTPEAALETLIHLNNRYAVDGRDPNSYSGIFWTLGRYDRPWAPVRPVFGSVRYMSSANTKKKLHLKRYLERWGGQGPTQGALFGD